jgi:hypothetical protein
MSANVPTGFGSVRRAIKISEQFWRVERIFAFRSERCDELTAQRSTFRRGRFSPPLACPDGRRWPAISRQCLSPSPLACARDEDLRSRRFDSIYFRGCSPMLPGISWKLPRDRRRIDQDRQGGYRSAAGGGRSDQKDFGEVIVALARFSRRICIVDFDRVR